MAEATEDLEKARLEAVKKALEAEEKLEKLKLEEEEALAEGNDEEAAKRATEAVED